MHLVVLVVSSRSITRGTVGFQIPLILALLIDYIYEVAMPLNCPGMYRGVIREDGTPKTAIFSDEEVA